MRKASEHTPRPAGGIFLSGLALTACLFSLVVVLLALMLIVARSGLPIPYRQIVLCVLLFCAGAFAPFVVHGGRKTAAAAVPGAAVIWAPFWTFVVWASPLSAFVVRLPLEYLYGAIALAGFVRAWPTLKTPGRGAWLFIAGVAPLAALYMFLQINNGLAGGNVLSPEMALTGFLNRDAKLHSAVTYLIQNYGVASLGMDGLVPFRYHVGSHWWFAAIGKVTQDPPVVSYVTGSHLLMVPAVWFAYCAAATCAVRGRQPVLHTLALTLGLIFLMDVTFGFGSNKSWWMGYYISESCTFAFAALGLLLPLLLACADVQGRYGRADAVARWVVAVGAVFVLLSLKSSAGLLWAVACGYVALRTLRLAQCAFVLVGLALTGFVAARSFAPGVGDYLPQSQALFVPLYFFRMWPDGYATASFFACLILPVSLAWLMWKRSGQDLKAFALSPAPESVVAQAVLIVAVVSALPALVGIPQDSSVFYFICFAHWFGVPLMIASVSIDGLRSMLKSVFQQEAGFLVLGVLAIVTVGNAMNMFNPSAFRKIYGDVLRSVDEAGMPRILQEGAATRYVSRSLRFEHVLIGHELRAKLAETVGYKTILRVDEMIARQGTRAESAVFIPPTNKKWWGFIPNCLHIYHAQPSLTGVPSFLGAPPASLGCEKQPYQGAYGGSAEARQIGPEALCAHARTRGVRHVLVLNDVDDPSANRILECAPR